MPEAFDVRARPSLLSGLARIAAAATIVSALVLTAGTAAWANARHKPHTGTTGGTTGGLPSPGSYGGNPNYGWVIPITFSYAPSAARVPWLSLCPSSGGPRSSASTVSFKTTDGSTAVMGQHILVSVSGPATYW